MNLCREIKLHPNAEDFLFENFATLRRIFSDVLGQLEIDYISIGLVNEAGEIFFLSSSPSIEKNLIEKDLWGYDYIYQPHFVYQSELTLWSEISPTAYHEPLKRYKQQHQNLIDGVSIPIDYGVYRAILSFGFKESSSLSKIRFNKCEKLLAMGQFCLNRISKMITFPDQKKNGIQKPKLTLIINRSRPL